MKLKSKGDAVKSLQQKLITLGFKITADGEFGPTTEKSVKKFQDANGLLADGIVGPITLNAINLKTEPQEVLGIDVSSHQELIDWDKVAKTEYKFFILKSTEGVDFSDKSFATNYAELKRLGLIRGAYHFYSFLTDPKKQAQDFLASNFDFNDTMSLPPILDIEKEGAAAKAKIKSESARHVANIKIWLDEVENKTGRKPMIYTQKSFWDDILGSPKGFGGYPLWVAHYTKANAPLMPAGWNQWKLWQFSDKMEVKGIKTLVDINRFKGSMTDLKKMLS